VEKRCRELADSVERLQSECMVKSARIEALERDPSVAANERAVVLLMLWTYS
jgi:hypothetical protein